MVPSDGDVATIVVAAGSGRRFGGPKQFARLGAETVLERSVRLARRSSDYVVVVLPVDRLEAALAGVDAVVVGGATRSESVRAGLAVVPSSVGIVVVHDAARPLASESLFSRVVTAVRSGADGAVPGLPVRDTLKSVRDGWVRATLDRQSLVAVQTPQAFRIAALRSAHEGAPEATDDASLVEAAGGRVALVSGEEWNMKLTTPADLRLAQAWLDAGAR